MGSRGVSTKERLLSLVDDIETISKALLESTIAPKQEKLSHIEQTQMVQLVMAKNDELREYLKIAEEQAEIDRKMAELQGEVSKHDQDIQMLQKHLKDAETLLSTALYQARMKLDQITKAQHHSVNSEDLIRFAHRISSTNAVAAPTTWQPGDQRRPFPTDLEMRMGLLMRLNDLPLNKVLDAMPRETMLGSSLGNPFPPWHPHAHHSGQTPDHSSSSSLPTSSTMFHPPSHNQQQHSHATSSPNVGIDPSTRNHDEVEVMSTDSSSSSSSDSQ